MGSRAWVREADHSSGVPIGLETALLLTTGNVVCRSQPMQNKFLCFWLHTNLLKRGAMGASPLSIADQVSAALPIHPLLSEVC